ncbi:hypothetical protein DFAR_960001 [Desulfarculales bacterium]
MRRGDDWSLLLGCSYDHASGQVVGLSEEAAGALLYGGDGLIRKRETVLAQGHREAVISSRW